MTGGGWVGRDAVCLLLIVWSVFLFCLWGRGMVAGGLLVQVIFGVLAVGVYSVSLTDRHYSVHMNYLWDHEGCGACIGTIKVHFLPNTAVNHSKIGVRNENHTYIHKTVRHTTTREPYF